MEIIPPVLVLDKWKLILVTHDECIFYANDRKRRIWVNNEKMSLQKKGNSQLIMVNEFLSETCGRLKLNEEEITRNPDVLMEAHYYLRPELGANSNSDEEILHVAEMYKKDFALKNHSFLNIVTDQTIHSRLIKYKFEMAVDYRSIARVLDFI
ncbi:hypothetical protein Glove_142g53 [Diversispora epigaea]|uniref:Uncharacterized protein n=1 Tax=Diversispora epigaea TaxID=1348612 RepID=A0A397IX73_9GLOM|nr:hypothetical protein Glove_142g53 [Diversispora epigaea]